MAFNAKIKAMIIGQQLPKKAIVCTVLAMAKWNEQRVWRAVSVIDYF